MTGDAQTGETNQLLPIPLTVQVLDAAGRGVPGVKVDWNIMAGDGALLARVFPTVTDSTGLVLVFWRLGYALDRPQRVVAACCGVPAATFKAQAVFPLAQRLTVIGGWWQRDTVGHTLTLPLVAQVVRADGTPDVGATVGWRSISRGGRFSPTFGRADSAGRAATLWTLGTVAGAESTAAVVRGLPPALVLATALPGPAARVAIRPTTLPVLSVIGDTVHVSAQAWDQYGNVEIDPVSLRATDSTIALVSGAVVQARHHGTTWITGQVGVLGDSVPLTVLGFAGVSDGGRHTCAVGLTGTVYCWGENFQGSIGDGTRVDRTRPVAIAQGLGLLLPRTKLPTCALTAEGKAYCWGPDASGELGDGSANHAFDYRDTVPVPVAGGLVFSSISPGRSHTCGVTTTNDAYCWGSNYIGQLGRDTLTNTCIQNGVYCSNTPILVAGGLKFTSVSAGFWEHNCGVTTAGAAYCWGAAGDGRLGNDSATQVCGVATVQEPCSRTPVQVEGGLRFQSVSAGGYFTCGLAVTGDGYCWGYGYWGALGNGSRASSTLPIKVTGGFTFRDVQAGFWHGCGLTTGGAVYCWGGSYGATPVAVLPNVTVGAIAVGGDGGSAHTCALSVDQDLYCWYSGPN